MRKWLKGLLWTVGALAAIALVLRLLVLDVWRIPDDPVLSASIAPTLSGGDVVLVLTRGTPGFGELVRCPDPDEPGNHIVGRIAGLEGDEVETDGGILRVNGTNYGDESACPDPVLTIVHPSTGREVEIQCHVAAMGGGRHFRGLSKKGPLETLKRTKVRPDTVFLISDNRNFHDDSRDFGLQPRDACKQRIFFRLWGKSGWGDDERRLSWIR